MRFEVAHEAMKRACDDVRLAFVECTKQRRSIIMKLSVPEQYFRLGSCDHGTPPPY
jgi:hypothetical protein